MHRRTLQLGTFALLAALTCAASACGGRNLFAYDPERLRAVAASRVPTLSAAEVEVPFEVGPAWVERARAAAGHGAPSDRAQRLANAILDPEQFGLEYRPAVTAAAHATLERGYGNCLSLASVFVGLARAIGLAAFYVDASERKTESAQVHEFLVSSGHIAALVYTERGFQTVDFDGELVHYRRFEIIDDLWALAHFFNNRGYEIIHQAQREEQPIDWQEVRRHFERATLLQPAFASAWNNLGLAYARLGQRDEAEQRYRVALARSERLAAPYNNLGSLYLEQGDPAAALEAFDAACRLQPKSPYYHYNRAQALHRAGRTREAVAALERCLELSEDFSAPRELLVRIEEEVAQQGTPGD